MVKEILQQVFNFLKENPLIAVFVLLCFVLLVVGLSKSKIKNMNNFRNGQQVGIGGILNVGQKHRRNDK